MTKFTLNCLLMSSIFPLPISTAKKRLLVESIMVLKIPINEIILPRTENNPKSVTPKACNA